MGLSGPATIVGEVVRLRGELGWFEERIDENEAPFDEKR